MFILSNRYCFPLKNQEMMGSLSGHLPDELVKEILVKLPAFFILSFKRVSKSWYNLLSSPCFIHLHSLTPHSPSQPFALLHQSSHKKSRILTISLKHHENIKRLCEVPHSSSWMPRSIKCRNGVLCLLHCQPCNRPIHPPSACSWAACTVFWILFRLPNLQIQGVGSTLNENYWRLCGLRLINRENGNSSTT
ncbi:hypothetical protein AMTRI_Chr06g174260 [Amborella trichopoda]